MRRLGMVRHGGAALLALVVGVTVARAADRPYFAQARAVFDRLPARDRNEAFLELMATGDFDAMASNQFGTRLYDATASFQDENGLPPSGVLTAETRAALSAVGGRIFNSWGLEFLDHPFAEAAVAIPGGFALDRTATGHGVALENRRHTMSVSFAFFADGEATLQNVFDNLTRPVPGRTVTLQVVRPDVLAVAASTGTSSSYSRYIPVPGGIAGFTLSWNPLAYPNAGRIAVVMANELYPRRMVGGGDLFDSLPGGTATPISPGSDPDSVARQRDAQEQAGRQAEADRQQAQARYFEQLRMAREETERKSAIEAAARQAAEERARVAREADAARRAKVEADRQVAVDRVRAERLDLARAAGDGALKDAADFVKANRDDPQLMDHLQRIADLKTAAGGADPAAIERRRSELQARLQADAAYAGWEARQIADRQRDDDAALRDTLRIVAVQKAFLVETVTRDPTAPYAIAFLPLARQAEAAIATPSLPAAQTLMGTIEREIEKAGFHDSYALRRAEAQKP